MRALLIAIVACLTSCSRESAGAEEEYRIVSNQGSKDDVCKAARNVQNAYLKEKNEISFEHSKLNADIDCQAADLER